MAKAEKKKKTTTRRRVPRQTRKFQLRHEHPTDRHVGEILDYARTQRREVTVIRDGVRLLWALENNDLSVLFELFPHLKEQFVPAGLSLIEQFQAMLLQTREFAVSPAPAALGQGTLSALTPTAGPKTLTAAKLELPVFLDDDDTLVIKKSQGGSSIMNFVSVMKEFQ